MKGQTGENLILLLESRLDNLVYRLGIAPTRAAARQLVTHCHITRNGEVCNIPSTIVRPGETIEYVSVQRALKLSRIVFHSAGNFSWLEWMPQNSG